MTAEAIRHRSMIIFEVLKRRVKKNLCICLSEGRGLKTLSKTDVLGDIGRLMIAPDDQCIIPKCVQEAINTNEERDFELLCFYYRFGEKASKGIRLAEFGKENTEHATVHSAVNIGTDCDIDLLWSVDGLQQTVGRRGTISTCLSFSDCGNFQSNVDGRTLDIGIEL